MNKCKILFVLHMPPPVHGAAMVGQYIHDSELINSEFDCHYINLATASGLEDIGKFKFKKIVSFWNLLRRIRKSIRDLNPNLVYITPNANGGPFYKDFVAVLLLKTMGCKVIAHYHNKGVASRQNRVVDNFLYQRFFKGLKVILLSERLYPDIQKYVRREDVYVCPNGIPRDMKPRERILHDIPRILFLSNLLIEKGVLVLLDALKIIKDNGYSFVCDFVGSETTEIDANRMDEEIRKRNLQDAVLYHGKRYGAEKDMFLNDTDIFVFSTFYQNECFPLVLLEAMQHELPIITTNEGGISDIVKDGENGFICEKRNPIDLADKITCLLNDEQLRTKMGHDGNIKFKEKFTLEVFENRMVEILQSVVE